MAAPWVNVCYSTREVVELVLFEASDLKDFLDSGSQENIADSGKEFVPVDLEADPSDSDNNIFIFITGICATSRIKLIFTVFGQFLLCCCDRERYMTLWIIYLTSTHPKFSKNVYVYCIMPNSLFTTISFKRAKTVRLLEPSAPFCGVLNELNTQANCLNKTALDVKRL